MNRTVSIVTTLLVIALTAAGCASQTNAGWVTLIDGGTGLDNWIRVG